MTRHFCAACKSAAEPTHGTALSVHMSENVVLGTARTICKPEFGSTRWPLGPTTNSRHPGTPTDGERALSAPGAGDDTPVTHGRRRLETSTSFCTSGPPSHGRTVAQQRTTAEVLGNPLSHVWAPGIAAGVALTPTRCWRNAGDLRQLRTWSRKGSRSSGPRKPCLRSPRPSLQPRKTARAACSPGHAGARGRRGPRPNGHPRRPPWTRHAPPRGPAGRLVTRVPCPALQSRRDVLAVQSGRSSHRMGCRAETQRQTQRSGPSGQAASDQGA